MSCEAAESVEDAFVRMARVNSNVFYKCYKYREDGLFCQEVRGESFSGVELQEAVNIEYQKTKAKQ